MSAAIIWMSHTEAKIFRLSKGASSNAERLESPSHGHRHANEPNKQQDSEKFYHSVAARLEGMQEILLIGPGTAKQEFRHHLEKHHHAKLAKAVVGVENADHPTEPQILAFARKFFKTYDLYSGT